MRETVEVLSVVEALENKDMVILGAPGSGKTTFMKWLALTFAQKLSIERLELREDRLPIFITIQDISKLLSEDRGIADVLTKHINADLQVRLPDDYFLPYLEAGRCIVLFDGLDEVASVGQRGEVAEKVRRFASYYDKNRFIITSRIAGYREIQRLPESDFIHFTVRDFDDEQIQGFARNWYRLRHPEAAATRTDDLIAAIESNPKVKQLAINPLMLTIIAIVHRSSAELPNQRIKLYDLCTEALLFTWQRDHRRAHLTAVDGSLIRDSEVRRRLELLAYWMHEEAPAESRGQMHVPYKRLRSKLTDILVEREDLTARGGGRGGEALPGVYAGEHRRASGAGDRALCVRPSHLSGVFCCV